MQFRAVHQSASPPHFQRRDGQLRRSLSDAQRAGWQAI